MLLNILEGTELCPATHDPVPSVSSVEVDTACSTSVGLKLWHASKSLEGLIRVLGHTRGVSGSIDLREAGAGGGHECAFLTSS